MNHIVHIESNLKKRVEERKRQKGFLSRDKDFETLRPAHNRARLADNDFILSVA